MKKIVLHVPKVKPHKKLPSELVVTKIHKSPKDFRRNKLKLRNLNKDDIDTLDDRFYE